MDNNNFNTAALQEMADQIMGMADGFMKIADGIAAKIKDADYSNMTDEQKEKLKKTDFSEHEKKIEEMKAKMKELKDQQGKK